MKLFLSGIELSFAARNLADVAGLLRTGVLRPLAGLRAGDESVLAARVSPVSENAPLALPDSGVDGILHKDRGSRSVESDWGEVKGEYVRDGVPSALGQHS